jgi:DNA-binding XRE family transcriptional regulator
MNTIEKIASQTPYKTEKTTVLPQLFLALKMINA